MGKRSYVSSNGKRSAPPMDTCNIRGVTGDWYPFVEKGKSSNEFSCPESGKRECQTLTDQQPPRSYSCSSSRSPGKPARMKTAHNRNTQQNSVTQRADTNSACFSRTQYLLYRASSSSSVPSSSVDKR
uniref:SFRICE_037690 n=1 Tax=Spodoptera frugiperda TaxID=7108 RepID=A0A2H1WYX2_SPOFR